MAKRGTKKARSVEQENHVAFMYGGKRSPSSGASVTDKGDVRTSSELFECKMTGEPGKLCKDHYTPDCEECMRVATLVQQMEKVADEAWAEGKDPVVALRFYAPYSKLAKHGWVDMTVRMMDDDYERMPSFNCWMAQEGGSVCKG